MRRLTTACDVRRGTSPVLVRRSSPDTPRRCRSVTGPIVAWPRTWPWTDFQVMVSVA